MSEEVTGKTKPLKNEMQKARKGIDPSGKRTLPEEKTLENILSAVPVGVAYYEDRALKWANEAMLDMFGFETLEDAVGLSPTEPYSSEEEYQRVREIFFDSLARGEQAQADAQFKRRDGTLFHGHIVIRSQDASNPLEGTIACISDVDWRYRAEEALKEKEQLLEHILAASPVGLCLVENGTFGWANDAMLRTLLMGQQEELVGQSTRLMFESDSEYRKAGKTLYSGLETAPTTEIFAKLSRKDGSLFDAQIRASALDRTDPMKGTVAAVSDVSWLVQAEDALVESERRFREILENVHLVAVGMDVTGTISFVNDFLLELSGWERHEVLGRNWFETFVPPEHQEKQQSRFERIREGTIAIHGRTAILTKHGEKRIISWNNTVLRDPSKKITGLASIGEDITDRRRADSLLLQTERIKAVGEMAGAIAHNFNNLLQIVMGGAQMALVHLELGHMHQIKPSLEQIVKSSSLGARTVERLQEFARVRVEDATSEGIVFDLSHTVKQASEMSEPWWKTNPQMEGIAVTLDLDLAPECLVRGQENELFEVTVNLIKNAVEAMPQGGAIKISTQVDEETVVLQVKDTGVGIPQENLGKLFEPFWTTKGHQGTGIGLSSCYGIVRRHQGEISVQSSEGNGTCFTVRIPLDAKGIGDTDAFETAPDVKLRMLIVDDMLPVLSMLETGLTDFGQIVYTASSGKEAVDVFKTVPVDLVICDLGMEGMNGLQVSEAVRDICRDRSAVKTPFILLTGWGGQIGDDQKLQRAGVDKLVSKPVTIVKLLECAREAVNKAKTKQVHARPVNL